jgi:hypothetical protein
MPIPKEEVTEAARQALLTMLDQFGPDYKFPPDVIWQHLPPGVEVKSTDKPHQPARLVKEGYLAPTGGKAKAQSKQRSASTTNEYRFGPLLVPPREDAGHAVVEPAERVEEGAAVGGQMLRPSDALKAMHEHLAAQGNVLAIADLANFFLAMTVSPLVILSGVSGTGKSRLPRKFAELTNSLFHPIPVQPQWSDNSDLFGYVPTLAPTKFVAGELIADLLKARSQPEKLVIAVLDEMNLAPVEHYFSHFLSVAESRRREDGRIITDRLPIELPLAPGAGIDPEAALRDIWLPSNLRVVGTANMDETTHTFSPKVLDRAFTIELEDPELTTFASGAAVDANASFDILARIIIDESNRLTIHEARADSQDLFEYAAQLLFEIQEILAPAGIKFGYRTRDSILMYLHFWKALDLSDIMTGYAALDFCILQKILPKISGSGDSLADALDKLSKWLGSRVVLEEGADALAIDFTGPLARSQGKVDRMAEILKLDGATRFWGA